jgi:hypothetical protein
MLMSAEWGLRGVRAIAVCGVHEMQIPGQARDDGAAFVILEIASAIIRDPG